MGVFLGLETIIMITLLVTVPNRTGVKKSTVLESVEQTGSVVSF